MRDQKTSNREAELPAITRIGSGDWLGACVDCGGPMLKISVGGKVIEFEMHPYCGPNILNRKGEPLATQPHDFLVAASLWAQQGRRMEDGLCRWDHPPKEILKHLGGRHWQILGYEQPVRGT